MAQKHWIAKKRIEQKKRQWWDQNIRAAKAAGSDLSSVGASHEVPI